MMHIQACCRPDSERPKPEIELIIERLRETGFDGPLRGVLIKIRDKSFPEPKPPLSAARLAEMRAEESRIHNEISAKLNKQQRCTAEQMSEFMKLDKEIEALRKVLRNIEAIRHER